MQLSFFEVRLASLMTYQICLRILEMKFSIHTTGITREYLMIPAVAGYANHVRI